MKKIGKPEQMLNQLSRGKIYRLAQLNDFSNSVGRDVRRLTDGGMLQKVGPGLYYYPKQTRFGDLPPEDKLLVHSFLQDNNFLLLSSNWYNSLGLGLTQLRNETIVYNTKRHVVTELTGRTFHFRRPNNGFPKKLTREFLLVDLTPIFAII
jgi:hypothetical protein